MAKITFCVSCGEEKVTNLPCENHKGENKMNNLTRKMSVNDPLYISFPIVYGEKYTIKEKAVVFYNPFRWGFSVFFFDLNNKPKILILRVLRFIIECAIQMFLMGFNLEEEFFTGEN